MYFSIFGNKKKKQQTDIFDGKLRYFTFCLWRLNWASLRRDLGTSPAVFMSKTTDIFKWEVRKSQVVFLAAETSNTVC